jgi:hypothetical protein
MVRVVHIFVRMLINLVSFQYLSRFVTEVSKKRIQKEIKYLFQVRSLMRVTKVCV